MLAREINAIALDRVLRILKDRGELARDRRRVMWFVYILSPIIKVPISP